MTCTCSMVNYKHISKFPFPLKEAFLGVWGVGVESADQSFPVSKGVVLFLSSIFPSEGPLKNEEERETRGRKKGGRGGRGGGIENANPGGAFFPFFPTPLCLILSCRT